MEMMTLLVYITAQQSGPFLGDLLSTVHPQSGVFPVVLHHCPVNLFGFLALHGVQAAVQNSSCGGGARSSAGDMAGLGSAQEEQHMRTPHAQPLQLARGVFKHRIAAKQALSQSGHPIPALCPAMGLGRSAAGLCGEGGG